jgi:thiamine-phosphate pyrophosphorylase
MDQKLIAWARAVKARRSRLGRALPPLWVFSDRDRLPDPRGVLAGLPKGLCGVVLRPGGTDCSMLAGSLARLCRQRRFAMVIAGEPRLAARVGAGLHLSRGRPGRGGVAGVRTASAHGQVELVRAWRLGVDAVFLSPVFPTASHPGGAALGAVRWASLVRTARVPVLALGGITAATARRLPRRGCAGIGLIGAARA